MQEDGKVHRDPVALRVCTWRASGSGSIVYWHVGVGLEVGFRVGDIRGTECMLVLLLLSLSECLFRRAMSEE